MTGQNMQEEYARTLRLDDGLLAPYGGELVQAYVPANMRHELHARLPQLVPEALQRRESDRSCRCRTGN